MESRPVQAAPAAHGGKGVPWSGPPSIPVAVCRVCRELSTDVRLWWPPIRGVTLSRMIDQTKAFSGFSVRDLHEARVFYEESLGLSITEEHGMLSIDLGSDHHVLVYPKGSAHQAASFTVLNFPVPDVDATVDELAAKGVVFARYDGMTDDKGVNRHGGPLIAWFTDPSGNVMSVIAMQELGEP